MQESPDSLPFFMWESGYARLELVLCPDRFWNFRKGLGMRLTQNMNVHHD